MAYDRLVRAPRPTRDVSLRPRSAFTLTGSASRAPGATRRKAERALHRSTGRAARLSWPTRGRRRLARGLMFISVNVEPETREAAIAALDALRAELEAKGVSVKEGSWGYRLLVVDDPDGNQLFFNYPNETASGKIVGDEE